MLLKKIRCENQEIHVLPSRVNQHDGVNEFLSAVCIQRFPSFGAICIVISHIELRRQRPRGAGSHTNTSPGIKYLALLLNKNNFIIP